MRYWDPKLLNRLLEVQKVDLEIRKLEFAIDDFYRRSKEEDPLLVQLKKELADFDESISITEAQHQMYVSTLDDIRTAIRGLATTKSGAPKPRTRSSTEALRVEEEKLTSMISEIDEQIKSLNDERLTTLSRIKARSLEVEAMQQGPEAEIRKFRLKINRLQKQRSSSVEGMPSQLLRKYDRLRSSRSGIGLTILRDGVCTVCRMQMPTAILSQLHRGEHIRTCPACGRMVARVEFLTPLPISKSEANRREKMGDEKGANAPDASTGHREKKAPAKKAPAKKAPAKKAPAKKAPAKKAAKKK